MQATYLSHARDKTEWKKSNLVLRLGFKDEKTEVCHEE